MSETTESTNEGTEAKTTESQTEGTEQTTETVAGEEKLGDAGKKALDTMKAERNAAKQAHRELEEKFNALQAQVQGKQAEYEQEQAARKVEAEALAKANERILKAEVRAVAANKLADPKDALLHIDLSTFEVNADGEVDTAAVTTAINDLITAKPYLAAQGSRFQGTADGGPRTGDTKPSQLSRADLASMTPEQINTARSEGRLANLLGGK